MALSRDDMLAAMYRRDTGFNGRYVTAVVSTGIYCLPDCPARKPKAGNVVFYDDETGAKQAGFRPCRRCRPDHFYRGYDPDRAIVDALVREIRADPARFADAARIGARAGYGRTALAALFRRHVHESPARVLMRARAAHAAALLATTSMPLADVAAAGGFSDSAFYAAFARRYGMRPAAYRDLGTCDRFRIRLPALFSDAALRRVQARDPDSACEGVSGNVCFKVVNIGGSAVQLELERRTNAIDCRWNAPRILSVAERYCLHAIALRLLGLACDPQPLQVIARRHPRLAALMARYPGLRVSLTTDRFEALVWGIIGQQINLAFACRLRTRLVRLAGTRARGGRFAHPTAEQVAQLDCADLTPHQFSRRKAEYVIDAARAVVDGSLPLDDSVTATGLDEALQACRGIGRWTAAYVLMRGAGFADCAPVGDSGLRAAFAQLYAMKERPDDAQVDAMLSDFTPARSLACLHLWMSLGAAP